MKTITDISLEIKALRDNIDKALKAYDLKKVKRFMERLRYLNDCILYLETKPTFEFITKEVKRLEESIRKRESDMEQTFSKPEYEKLTKPALTKLKKAREKELCLSKFREQLKTLKYLSKR